MADEVQERAGTKVLLCDPDGPTVATTQDALDLIGASYLGATVAAVPASRLDARFFDLETGVAGEVMQKFVTYRMQLAVVGDISEYLEASSALRALVYESNRAAHVWFVPDFDALDERLHAAA